MDQDLRGRVALVTGANAGVGLELTKLLLARGSAVAALVRSEFPDEPWAAQARTDNRLRVYRADFADFASLKRGLAAVKAGETKLDLLFNNAGAAFSELRRSARDHEAHFELNTVVPYLILEELGALLEAGELKTVVHTSSNALRFVKKFSVDLLEAPIKHVPLFGPYGASKLALSLWTREAAPAWKRKGITLVTACPGGTRTKMTARPQAWYMKVLFPLMSHPASEGARRILQASQLGAPPGSFVEGPQGKVVLPGFVDQGPRVLERVQKIYEEEYLPL